MSDHSNRLLFPYRPRSREMWIYAGLSAAMSASAWTVGGLHPSGAFAGLFGGDRDAVSVIAAILLAGIALLFVALGLGRFWIRAVLAVTADTLFVPAGFAWRDHTALRLNAIDTVKVVHFLGTRHAYIGSGCVKARFDGDCLPDNASFDRVVDLILARAPQAVSTFP